MKNLLFTAIAILGFSAISFGQTANATATASGTIITPILVTRTANMQFGNMISTTGGTVILNPTGSPTYSGVVAPTVQLGTITTATFDVSGTQNYLYTVALSTLPATVVHTDGSTTMTIDGFKSYINNVESTAGTLDNLGAQTIKVGATLHVGATQLAGVYTSPTSFTVTVNYN